MSVALLEWSVLIAQLLLGIAMICTMWRMIVGPRAQDRVLALDAFYVTAMLILVTFGMRTNITLYFEIALIIAMLGFAGTVAPLGTALTCAGSRRSLRCARKVDSRPTMSGSHSMKSSALWVQRVTDALVSSSACA